MTLLTDRHTYFAIIKLSIVPQADLIAKLQTELIFSDGTGIAAGSATKTLSDSCKKEYGQPKTDDYSITTINGRA